MLQQFNFSTQRPLLMLIPSELRWTTTPHTQFWPKPLLRRSGLHFTPQDVANAWLDLQGKKRHCTAAERVAYCNPYQRIRRRLPQNIKTLTGNGSGAQLRGTTMAISIPADLSQLRRWPGGMPPSPISKMAFYWECLLPPCWHKRQSAQTSGRYSPHRSFSDSQHLPALPGCFYRAGGLPRGHFEEKVCFDHIHRIYDEHSPHDW